MLKHLVDASIAAISPRQIYTSRSSAPGFCGLGSANPWRAAYSEYLSLLLLETMDRAELMSRMLERAEERVLVAERLIAHQRELINQMLKLGADVSGYREALARFDKIKVHG